MQWLSDVVGSALTSLLTELLLAALTMAAAYAVLYLRRLSERLQEQSQNELVDAAIRRLEGLVTDAILEAEATVARAVRQEVAAGRLSRANLSAIGNRVAQDVLRSLDQRTRQAIQGQFGDIQVYVRRKVEAQLEALKAQGVVPRMETLKQAGAASAPK